MARKLIACSLWSIDSKNIDAFNGRFNNQKAILNRALLDDENKQNKELGDSDNKINLLKPNENVSLGIYIFND